jgi:pimeloyl-ACP methyl ester carboxylesterase
MSMARTFLLIPGAGGEAWYWHLLTPLLGERGHRAIAVDLPAAEPQAGWAEYADAAVAVAAGAGPLTVVGQSMGGFTAPLVVSRLPVERIVLVNAMIPAAGETGGQWWDAVGQHEARVEQDRRQGRDPDAPFDEREMFFHDVPPAVVDEAFSRGEPAQADLPFRQPWPLDSWPDVPTSGIAGRDDRIFPADFQRRVARDRLGIELTVLPGGHLIALSNPEGLAEALLT